MQNILELQENIDVQEYFTKVADYLLNRCFLIVKDLKLRFVEIEFYYCGLDHEDVFTHCDDLQKTKGKWYFHRQGATHREGTYKGLDITFGDRGHYGGILIRSLQKENGEIIEGPCLCVNHLLDITGYNKVHELDECVQQFLVWEQNSLVSIAEEKHTPEPLYSTGRIGLSLKKSDNFTKRTEFILKPYRFCIFPHLLKKGKVYTILALYNKGYAIDTIMKLTNSSKKTVETYVGHCNNCCNDFANYKGIDLKPHLLSQLHGTWFKNSQ